MEFVPGRLWDSADYGDPDALRRLGERLYALHRLPVPAVERFDPWQVALAYLRQIDATCPDGAGSAALQRLEALCAGLRSDEGSRERGARRSLARATCCRVRGCGCWTGSMRSSAIR